jgi:hypothetical protein
MPEVKIIGTRLSEGWHAVAYDLQIRYGYDSMITLFDRFIVEYDFRLKRIGRAQVAGMEHEILYVVSLFKKTEQLSRMKAVKEECGELAIGGNAKALGGLKLFITLTNQTSVLVIQLYEDQYNEKVQEQLDGIARFFQSTLIKG